MTRQTGKHLMDEHRLAAERVCRILREAGYRALLAGGCVRDLLLKTIPKDYDIATNATPDRVAALFKKTISVGAAFGVQIVVMPEGMFEVATFRKDGPYLDGRRPSVVEFTDEQEDAQRRDFTINAMFYDPETNAVVDYVGGQDDLKCGIIRTVGEPAQRFQEDYLRLLRGVRFAARLGFQIDPPTFNAICENAPLILNTSAERIRDELLKMLTEGAPRRAFELLDQTGLLEHVLPEVARMKGVEQPLPYHPEGDVFEHTLLALEKMNAPSHTLAMGVLLHDVGKPLTHSVEDRIRFNYHDKTGAREAGVICSRLRMSSADIEQITWLVEQHMRIGAAPGMRPGKFKRFVREPGFSELLELFRLDCVASHNDLGIYQWIREQMAQLAPEEIRPEPLLTGRDLIALGYCAGPLFGEILRESEDAQLEGQLKTKDEAIAWVQYRWPLP